MVKLFKPLNNNKQYEGKLHSFDDSLLKIDIDEEIVEIERKNISLVKTLYNWDK
ncbi:MAG: hypothetical protein FWC68_05975 [Oscillospiraceae bacterium]|nr:hypothetical protein [Oscillospiraceae bacterium]